MSLAVGFIVLVVVAIVFVGVNLLSRTYNRGGRMPVDPLYSISQWDPRGNHFNSEQCTGAAVPGYCIIEGLQQSTIGATRTCSVAAGVCIDYDGSTVKGGESVPFRASCATPFCGWSQCQISFGNPDELSVRQYVTVTPSTGGTGFTISSAPIGSLFYMQRFHADGNGLHNDANGTLAQFYYIPPAPNSALQMLCYTNNANPPSGPEKEITMLSIQPPTRQTGTYLDMFVLMEAVPTSIAGGPGTSALNIMQRKILAFGGQDRHANPPVETLAKFNTHNMSSMWITAKAPDVQSLVIIRWTTEFGAGCYYGSPETTVWTKNIYNWNTGILGNLRQDVVESRLLPNSSPPFYSWEG